MACWVTAEATILFYLLHPVLGVGILGGEESVFSLLFYSPLFFFFLDFSNWLDRLKTYRAKRQAAETLLHLGNCTPGSIFSSLSSILEAKAKQEDSVTYLPAQESSCYCGNRSLTSARRLLPNRRTFHPKELLCCSHVHVLNEVFYLCCP